MSHQLQALPPFESYWDELPSFFTWLNNPELVEPRTREIIPSQSDTIDDTSIDLWKLGSDTQQLSLLDRILFAAANHLCVELVYRKENGKQNTYLIEPYALRRSSDNNLLLYSMKHGEADGGRPRAFRTDRIISAKAATDRTFTPMYRVEFLPSGPINTGVPVSSGKESLGLPSRKRRNNPSRRQGGTFTSGFGSKIKYVYQCPLCSKKFTRKTMDSRLNPHKNKQDWPCSGRSGVYVGTKY